MNIKRLITALFASLAVAAQANLIKNSDFNGKLLPEYRQDGQRDNNNFSLFTEDLTWNKCGKLEIINYNEDKDGIKGYSAGIVVGGDEKLAGFPVNPGTTYKFSIEIKGTLHSAFVGSIYWSGDCRYYDDRHRNPTSIGQVSVQKDWTKYNGTFTVPADAKRAALYISIWGSEKHKHMPDKPGEYLLIDNLNIEESKNKNLLTAQNQEELRPPPDIKKAVILKGATGEPVIDGKLNDEQWKNATEISGFYFYKDETPAKEKTSAKFIAGEKALFIAVKCNEPEIEKLKDDLTGNDRKEIWDNDNLEIFFAPESKDRVLNQFVIGAGGARWMGWGTQTEQPPVSDYDRWEAVTSKEKDCWTAEIKIPYEILGWLQKPAPGTVVPFNICRQRLAGKTELSSWNPVRGNFHDKKRYGILALLTLNKNIEDQIKSLTGKLSEIKDESPEKKTINTSLNELSRSLEKELSPEEWQTSREKLMQLEREMLFVKLKSITYAVTQIDPYSTDLGLPLIPENIRLNDETIKCKAAINEFTSAAVLVTNLTNEPQDYRVLLISGEEDGIEVSGLKSKDTVFPADKIELRQGIRVKDSDGKSHQQRFDPLVLMNQGFTITIPPKDSGLLWISLDCRGVKSSLYKGAVRIIPLNENGKFTNTSKGWQYSGTMRDIPFELEVIPVELSTEAPIPLWLMREAKNEKFFKDMIEHDNRIFQLSPYSFKMEFDKEGNAIGEFDAKIHNVVKKHLEWAKKYNVKIQFLIGFSAYNIFQQHIAKNKFNYGTPEWRNAWAGWINKIVELFKQHDVKPANYCMEVWDEPHTIDAEKVIETCRIAKENCPPMQLLITLGASRHSTENLKKIISFSDIWCLWGAYYDDPDFKPVLEELNAKGKQIWMYHCDTNLRASPYRYYRLHAWKGLQQGNPALGLFIYLNGPGGYYGRDSWKTCSFGGLIYNSLNEPVPSIRYECFQEGFNDVRYMKKLEKCIAEAMAKGIGPELTKEAAEFLKQASFDVAVKQPHDTSMAQQKREKAADFIIKLEEAMRK